MPGPGETYQFALPSAESGKVYASAELAWRIENLQPAPEGTLRSVRGPCPLIPDTGSGYPYGGRVHGVYHALLDHGQRDVTLVRAGDSLYVYAGYDMPGGGLKLLASGLSSDPHPRFPDRFVEVAGKIVWTNGVDAPRIYDGYTIKTLGHQKAPAPPTVLSPSDSGHPAFRNQGGFSHPGKIGQVGDFFSTDSGALLAGTWTYYVQLEDVFGDLSPLSPGTSAVLRQELTANSFWQNYGDYPGMTDAFLGIGGTPTQLGLLAVGFDDLRRQFCITDAANGPQGVVARWYWRTAANDPTPRFLARIGDQVSTVFPDNTPDANLGPPAKDYTVVPRFAVACSYQGRLAVLEGGRVRLSEPGQPGTFLRDLYVPIDSDGAQGTGLVVFGDALLAFTSTTLFRIVLDAEGLRAQPLSTGTGCVAPESIVTTDEGLLVWLGRRAWYAMTPDGTTTNISKAEDRLFNRLNPTALSRAVAVWSNYTREYICFVPEAGNLSNQLGMAWDGKGWRRYRLGLSVETVCATRDWRDYVLIGGRNGTENNVWVLDHEVRNYTLPAKTSLYQSGWIRLDATGRTTFNADMVYVGLVESTDRPVTWRLWRDDNRDTLVSTGVFKPMDPSTVDKLDTVVIDSGKFHNPRLTWYCFDLGLADVRSFAFDLLCEDPTFLHLAAFAFDAHTVDSAGARVNR